ncbi:hypothetical protein DVH05_015822 [Phytophthora capsici]|nr:hypothetical protein DVH05_015822 [Phytophthora capsici]
MYHSTPEFSKDQICYAQHHPGENENFFLQEFTAMGFSGLEAHPRRFAMEAGALYQAKVDAIAMTQQLQRKPLRIPGRWPNQTVRTSHRHWYRRRDLVRPVVGRAYSRRERGKRNSWQPARMSGKPVGSVPGPRRWRLRFLQALLLGSVLYVAVALSWVICNVHSTGSQGDSLEFATAFDKMRQPMANALQRVKNRMEEMQRALSPQELEAVEHARSVLNLPSGDLQGRNLTCIGWRATGRCKPDGPREVENDLTCNLMEDPAIVRSRMSTRENSSASCVERVRSTRSRRCFAVLVLAISSTITSKR